MLASSSRKRRKEKRDNIEPNTRPAIQQGSHITLGILKQTTSLVQEAIHFFLLSSLHPSSSNTTINKSSFVNHYTYKTIQQNHSR